jgi:hypothetical protein
MANMDLGPFPKTLAASLSPAWAASGIVYHPREGWRRRSSGRGRKWDPFDAKTAIAETFPRLPEAQRNAVWCWMGHLLFESEVGPQMDEPGGVDPITGLPLG